MKRILLLFTPILLYAGICSAQGFEWARQLGGTDVDNVLGLTTDASGNVFATGRFKGTADFDPGSAELNLVSAGGFDAFVVKLDANGSLHWAKAFGGAGSDLGLQIKTDANGNVYVMGGFTGVSDFDPGAGTSTLSSQGGYRQDLFVVKLDASGNFVWAIQRQSPNGEAGLNDCDLKLDAANSLHMTYCFTNGGNGGTQVIIEKANSGNGATNWTKTISTTTGAAVTPALAYTALALDSSGNIFVAGEWGGNVNFDPNGSYVVQALNAPSAYVLKLTNTGSFSWLAPLKAAPGGSCKLFDLAVDTAGSIIASGRYNGTVDFDPGAGVHNETKVGAINAYLLKLTGAGTYSWVRQYGLQGMTSATVVATDAAGGIYTSGIFQDSCTFGVLPNTITLNNNINSYHEGYTAKFSNNGGLEWVQQLGGGLTDVTQGNAIAVSNMGAIYTGGLFYATSNFDVISTNGFTLTSKGDADGYIQKVAGCAPVNIGVTLEAATSTLTATAAGATYQWLNCGTNTPVPGATAQTFTPTVTGNYAVVVMQNGCGDTSACTSVIGTNIAGMHRSVTAIYPNPTSGDIMIELNNKYNKVEVEITSAIGTIVSKTAYSNTQSIQARVNGASGVYFISIVADGVLIARERVVKAD